LTQPLRDPASTHRSYPRRPESIGPCKAAFARVSSHACASEDDLRTAVLER